MKVIVSVFNNLFTDQRVEKVCKTIHDNGFEVMLFGNNWDGLPGMKRPYFFTRICLKSTKLRFAYLEYNLKLYRAILKVADHNTLLLSNDLDTLLANYLVSKKLGIPLVFDSHEIFTEMPSVKGRWVQNIWRLLERNILPKIKYIITASNSYADWFTNKYKINRPIVVQNFPLFNNISTVDDPNSSKEKIILYQGWLNYSRGIDKVIEAMPFIENAHFLIAGDGPMKQTFQLLTKNLVLEKKVTFLGKIAPSELKEITKNVDVGLSVEENNGLSYYYSLPNKISDYIQARVPVVVSDFPEMKKIVEKFHVGETISNHLPETIAEKINLVFNKGKNNYQEALEDAAKTLCWENEAPKIILLLEKIVKENFPN